MLRFILFLFGRTFEPCKGCETLKQQLTLANEEKKQLTDTLISILKPKVYEAPPIELNRIQATSALFSRRRAALEARDREQARILRDSNIIGRSDNQSNSFNQNTDLNSISSLESELGIEEGVI